MSTSENNKRIAKNTMMLYIRMLLVMGVTLYTSRVVLNILGVEDFGIYNVVGGTIAMLGFLNASMSISVQRFLSFELGKNNQKNLRDIFNTSLIAHITIALIVLILAETIGLWFIKEYLNVPRSRADAVFWVYQFSILTCLCTIIQVPYNAIIIANERMNMYAYISIVEVVLKLVIVFILLISESDKLVLYAMLNLFISLIISAFYIFYCIRSFKESHFQCILNKRLLKSMISFASWSMLGESSWIITLQGVNLLLNIFFNPTVNAARGISYQISGAISRFSINFQMAVKPQIIKRYASKELDDMFDLTFQSTCLSFYLLLFLSLPILLETEQILKIWLGIVPDYTVTFSRLVIVTSLIDVLASLLSTIASATGKIRRYYSITSLVLMLNFPVSYLMLKLGGTPESTLYIYGGISAVLLMIRLSLLKQLISLSITDFFKKVLFRITKVSLLAIIIPIAFHLLIPIGIGRLLGCILVSVISVSLSVYLIGLQPGERLLVISYIKKLRIKRSKNA
ncbi:oligosaccharide flippase family protein [Bacteroides fragilis]|uniref:Lipopolysaccharide biosynthesis protein n=1 Tax=Bacteroides fragilis TaxID=817 RepID=A0AAP9D0H8_BACFG|nr:oligosaccharide flippase family protein [Bacteroides fragilis]MBV4152237.1 oligosaccharide flippase family protein [Bacteroides fragilis]MCE8579869.1 oligosaccharide flippase family protein [Bacteroides fragilis]MCM0347274.1 oligosaccharide flippase family protein [Bacteroides fragilis]MCM0368927.1 oligosaccharide flippase family protein [Bacteroides fragilis]MCS2537291.1 oligosaccharide flippase family protein [Bacteroides fragilis]